MKQFISFFLFLSSFHSLALDLDQMPIPPSREKTRSFTLLYVDRQPDVPAFLKAKINTLESKSRANWTSSDSLTFAFELVYMKDFTHALNYFARLNTDTISHPVTLQLLEFTFLKTNRFTSLKRSIAHGSNSAPVKEIRLRLVEVREMNLNGSWDRNKDVIFPILIDTSNFLYKRTQKQFYKYLVPRAEDFKKALLYDAIYTDDSDPILSQAFEEYGDFLHQHFYLTNAFMAYSISRFYNKRNSSTASKLKNIKREMDEANFLPPSIRENFSKINSEKYVFKELALTSIDSLTQNKTKSLTLEDIAELDAKKQPDYLPWINYEVLLISILFLILFSIILFVRTK